ncbi:hypothetical protein Bca101_070409 [Brassica carinata]
MYSGKRREKFEVHVRLCNQFLVLSLNEETIPLPPICGSPSRKSSSDDRYAAELGGCSALRCGYEVGVASVKKGVGFSGFLVGSSFSLLLNSLSRVGGACGGYGGPSSRSGHQSYRSACCGLDLWRGVGVSVGGSPRRLGGSILSVRHHESSGVNFSRRHVSPCSFLVRAGASMVSVWSFDGLLVRLGRLWPCRHGSGDLSLICSVSTRCRFPFRLLSYRKASLVPAPECLLWSYLGHLCDNVTV